MVLKSGFRESPRRYRTQLEGASDKRNSLIQNPPYFSSRCECVSFSFRSSASSFSSCYVQLFSTPSVLSVQQGLAGGANVRFFFCWSRSSTLVSHRQSASFSRHYKLHGHEKQRWLRMSSTVSGVWHPRGGICNSGRLWLCSKTVGFEMTKTACSARLSEL